jgi:asparagine synthase (glutamine-hydrolysing)
MLVRDRLGVKPLVYALKKGGVAFASTIQALQRTGCVQDIDDAAVLDFIEFGWIPDGRAIFAGAVKLPAATIAEWRNGKMTQRKYWSVPEAGTAGSIRFGEAVEATEAALVEAVRLRLFADVPVGALLSGGIDSTLVCWAMAKLNANITAFTISTPGDPSDEADDARRTAQLLGISHEVIELPPAGQTNIEELVSAYAEPFASPSALGMLRVSKAVKPKVTVLLTGDGGDDIFLGYPRQRHMWWAQRTARMLPGPVAALWPHLRKAVNRAPRLRRPMHFMDYATEGLSAASMNADLLGYFERRGMLGRRLDGARRPPMKSSLASARQLLPQFLNHEWQTQFTGEYMTKVDGATMYHAVEARSPFLDHVLWELGGALPYDVRLHRGELKAVLREIVRRRVHPEVAARRKKGFEIPVQNWLLTEWRAQLDEIRDGSVLEQEGWTNPGSIGRAITEARECQAIPSQLWRLIILEQWLRTKMPVLTRV